MGGMVKPASGMRAATRWERLIIFLPGLAMVRYRAPRPGLSSLSFHSWLDERPDRATRDGGSAVRGCHGPRSGEQTRSGMVKPANGIRAATRWACRIPFFPGLAMVGYCAPRPGLTILRLH